MCFLYATRANAEEQTVFSCTVLLRMQTKSPRLRLRYSRGCGQIARVCMYAIRAGAVEKPSVCVYAIRAYADE